MAILVFSVLNRNPDYLASEVNVGVFSNANGISLFLMTFSRMRLHFKLFPVQYRKYKYDLSIVVTVFVFVVNICSFPGRTSL